MMDIAAAPVAPSPQCALMTAEERVSDRIGPLPSSAITGITKKTAATSVQPRIATIRCMAALIPHPPWCPLRAGGERHVEEDRDER